MPRKEYAFYPGCSSQKGASASNYLTSVESMCKTLDIKITEIPDWNCCGASFSYAEAGELPRHAMNARNFALAESNLPGQDIVATPYDQKVTCCGGALAFSEPDKAQAQIKDIIEAAYDSGAEMLVTPCPLCRPTPRSIRARSTRSTAPSSTCRCCTTAS